MGPGHSDQECESRSCTVVLSGTQDSEYLRNGDSMNIDILK